MSTPSSPPKNPRQRAEPATASPSDPQGGEAASDALERVGTHPLGTAAGAAIGTGSVSTGPIEGPGVPADRQLEEVPCENCAGTGRTGSAPCQQCKGSGKIQRVVASR